MSRPEKTTEQKFSEYINKKSGKYYNDTLCWEWLGNYDKDGYGKLSIKRNGKSVSWRAHRWVYSLFKILEAKPLDHLCKNVKCVNPDHLEHKTPKSNNACSNSPSAQNARKTKCIHGHEFSFENTYYDKRGWRQCRRCNQLRWIESKRLELQGK